jgi:hypothetical protein
MGDYTYWIRKKYKKKMWNSHWLSKERILKMNKLLLKYCTTAVEDIDVNYFINNDDNGTDD